MRVNQFARNLPSYSTQVAELIKLRFLADERSVTSRTPLFLWGRFIKHAACEATTPTSKAAVFDQLLVDETTSLTTAYGEQQPVSRDRFYCVALQLLGFLVDEDFTPARWEEFWKQTNLPTPCSSVSSVSEVITAWYQLLQTPTKFGVCYLDLLASRGFFKRICPTEPTHPLFINGKAQPVFDPTKALREVVYVESPQDTDGDGKRDLLAVQLIRPKATEAGLKAPVVFTASPYNRGTNDKLGKQLTHDVNVGLTARTPDETTPAAVHAAATAARTKHLANVPAASPIAAVPEVRHATESFHNEYSYPLNDYLLARGFAVAYSAGIGTKDSDGLRTCGSVDETIAATSVIKWLGGKLPAFVDRNRSAKITAWWCNHNVAMTGKSYLGTLAVAAATTGVPELKTVIAEAAISNWYDYYREGGLVVAPGGFPGEDCDVLAAECTSRRHNAAEFHRIKPLFDQSLREMAQAQDRPNGNYTAFWDERNYRNDADKITCDVMLVHGLNDRNVKLRNVYRLWNKLPQGHHKLILHQGQHIYINNLASLDFCGLANLWLSRKLFDCANDAEHLIPPVLVQDNKNPGLWRAQSNWQPENSVTRTWYFTPAPEAGATLTASQPTTPATATFTDHVAPTDFAHWRKHYSQWRTALVTGKAGLKPTRIAAAGAPLAVDRMLTGEPQIKLRVATDRDHGLISCMLVDLGKAKRPNLTPSIIDPKGLPLGLNQAPQHLVDFKLGAETPLRVISQGFCNLQNQRDLTSTQAVVPHEAVDVTVTLQPLNYHLPAGHRLGVVLYATDMEMTVGNNTEQKYTVDLAHSQLQLTTAPVAAE